MHRYTTCVKITFYKDFEGRIVIRDEFLHFQNFFTEKYGSSALKCCVGRLHARSDKIFTSKSKIYMESHQNVLGSNKTGYPDGLSTSYLYIPFLAQ